MFTGIIQTIGKVAEVQNVSGDIRLTLVANDFAGEVIELGDSIACNGVCLTVIEKKTVANNLNLSFDVSRESLQISLIEKWKTGDRVNMELAMLPTTRFGGHIVSGHVDGLAEITKMTEDARSWRIWFRVSDDLKRYVAAKGSITIDGISLTVNGVEGNQFHINVVPHTMVVTNMGKKKVGDQVHIEVDLIARYLENLLLSNGDSSREDESGNKVNKELLQKFGFM